MKAYTSEFRQPGIPEIQNRQAFRDYIDLPDCIALYAFSSNGLVSIHHKINNTEQISRSTDAARTRCIACIYMLTLTDRPKL
jgi:hypothetical protein